MDPGLHKEEKDKERAAEDSRRNEKGKGRATRGTSGAKGGSMHVYGFCALGERSAHTYTHVHAPVHTYTYRRNDRYLASSNFGYTYLVFSVKET